MTTGGFQSYPGVYHLRNWILQIIVSVLIIGYSVLEYAKVIQSNSPPAATILWIILWAYILLMAVIRRLIISEDGIEYATESGRLRVKWSEVKYIEIRKSFANLWFASEGLVIRTDLPDAKEHFVELTQFGGRSWRIGLLGKVLQMKAPQLFSGGEPKH